METILQKIVGTLLIPLVGLMNWTGVIPKTEDATPIIKQEISRQLDESFGAFNISGGGTYRLKSSIGTTDTSINLSTFKEPVSNTPYTMNYFGAEVMYGTLNPQTSRSEFISFTGVTQNSDGSAILTGVTRGLTRTPQPTVGCTASTTLAQRHSGQTVFILSDSPCVFSEYAAKRNDETITGSWAYPTPTSANNPATKGYVDALVLGGSPTVDQVVVGGLAGETVATGTIVFYDRFQKEWMKADADLASTTDDTLFGITQGSGTNGVAINGGVLLRGIDDYQGSTLTQGQILYLSNTAGATSTSAGTNQKILGYVKDNNEFYFEPSFSYLAGTGQKLALSGAGTTSPSQTNRFETAISNQTSTSTYAADAGSTDAYAITLIPSPGAYNTGLKVQFKANTANATTSSLNLNGLGAKTLKKWGNVDLETGDIKASQIVEAFYDGTNFQIISPLSKEKYLYSTTTGVDVSSTGRVFLMATTTIPANMIGVGDGIRLKGYVTSIGSSGSCGNLQFKLQAGNTTVDDMTGFGTADSTVGWFEMVWMNITSATQEGVWHYFTSATGAASAAYNQVHQQETFTSSIDMTADQQVSISANRASGSGCSMVIDDITVEKIK